MQEGESDHMYAAFEENDGSFEDVSNALSKDKTITNNQFFISRKDISLLNWTWDEKIN